MAWWRLARLVGPRGGDRRPLVGSAIVATTAPESYTRRRSIPSPFTWRRRRPNYPQTQVYTAPCGGRLLPDRAAIALYGDGVSVAYQWCGSQSAAVPPWPPAPPYR